MWVKHFGLETLVKYVSETFGLEAIEKCVSETFGLEM